MQVPAALLCIATHPNCKLHDLLAGICHNNVDHFEAVGAMLEKRSPRLIGR